MSYLLLLDGGDKQEYSTRQEANYYKKQNKKSKVVTEYEIYDLNLDLTQWADLRGADTGDRTKVIEESPKKALEKYIQQEQLNVIIKRDITNKGRFVVKSKDASYVYEVI